MFRKNPLKDPIKAIKEVISYFDQKIKEKFSSFREDLNRFYLEEDPKPDNLQYAIRDLGRWAAYADIRDRFIEALELIEGEEESRIMQPNNHHIWMIEVLTALHERESKFLIEPPIYLLHTRFETAQEEMGISFEEIEFSDIQYRDQFVHPVDHFIEYYLYDFTFSMMLYSLEKLMAAAMSSDSFEFLGNTLMLINQRHEEMATNITDENLANILDNINSMISGRTYYGLRREVVKGLDFTKLYWSNGAESWFISEGTYDQALVRQLIYKKEVDLGRLDANEIIVPYPPVIVKLIVSSLYPLPLYSSSMEGKARARKSGKQGPLISDRTAKNIVNSVALEAIRTNRIETYGLEKVEKMEAQHGSLTPNDWYVKHIADNIWENLLKAKAAENESEFEEITDRFNIKSVPGFYGQLKNWFEKRELQND